MLSRSLLTLPLRKVWGVVFVRPLSASPDVLPDRRGGEEVVHRGGDMAPFLDEPSDEAAEEIHQPRGEGTDDENGLALHAQRDVAGPRPF